MSEIRNPIRKPLAVLVAAVWISLCEFLRNQLVLMPLWVAHYRALGREFPARPMNGAVWGIWALLFAAVISVLTRRFSVLQTTLLAWVAGFVFMWLVIGNLGVLPFGILWLAIPWSLLETWVAAYLVKHLDRPLPRA